MTPFKVSLLLIAVSLANADTITTRDSRTWNGTITSIESGIVHLQSTFVDRSDSLSFGADYIRVIRFNSVTYNPGPDPVKNMPAPAAKNQVLPGLVYKRAKEPPQKCLNIRGKPGAFVCQSDPAGAKQSPIDPNNVLQILIQQ